MDSTFEATQNSSNNIQKVSIIIPTYNEEQSVTKLYEELTTALQNLAINYEIVFIDDGSTDRTIYELRQINSKDVGKHVKIIRLRRNYGQSTAMDVGFRYATGDVIITLDADGQNDPADIQGILALIEKGYDVVSGWRKNRKDPLGKKIPSKFSNWLSRRLTKVNIHDSGCTLKAYRKAAIAKLRLHGEAHRYIPALLASQGFSVTEIVVNHRERKAGTSKYGAGRLIRGGLDLLNLFFITSYISKPIQFFGKIGALFISISAVTVLYKIAQSIIFGAPFELGPLLLMSALSFLAGLQFLLFGFMSEIQSRTYMVLNSEPRNEKVLFIEGGDSQP